MENDKPANSGINLPPEQLQQALEHDAAIREARTGAALTPPLENAPMLDRAAYFDAVAQLRGKCSFCGAVDQVVDARCRDCYAENNCIGCAMFVLGRQPDGCTRHGKESTPSTVRLMEDARRAQADRAKAQEESKERRDAMIGEASEFAKVLNDSHVALFGGKPWEKLTDGERRLRAAWAVDVMVKAPAAAAAQPAPAPNSHETLMARTRSALTNTMTAAHNLAHLAGLSPTDGEDMQRRVYMADAVHVLAQAARDQCDVLERLQKMQAQLEVSNG